MKFVTLIRHAKAGSEDAATADHERPLTARGHAEARALGARLADLAPDLALCSTALRATQTLRDAEAGSGLAVPAEFDRRLYLAPPSYLLDCLTRLPDDAKAVWIVGHNPGLHELVRMLCARTAAMTGSSEAFERFPTSASARFGFETSAWALIETAPVRLLSLDFP
jgi:phosphohistidine phosphatase